MTAQLIPLQTICLRETWVGSAVCVCVCVGRSDSNGCYKQDRRSAAFIPPSGARLTFQRTNAWLIPTQPGREPPPSFWQTSPGVTAPCSRTPVCATKGGKHGLVDADVRCLPLAQRECWETGPWQTQERGIGSRLNVYEHRHSYNAAPRNKDSQWAVNNGPNVLEMRGYLEQ